MRPRRRRHEMAYHPLELGCFRRIGFVFVTHGGEHTIMRNDLLEAQACVDWAVADIPLLEESIAAWRDSDPYPTFIDVESGTGRKLVKVRERSQLPLTVNAEIGAIINSVRSSLDVLARTLADRGGVRRGKHTQFPVFDSIAEFSHTKKGLKNIQWLTANQAIIIEKFKPYKGGNDVLYALHQLDIERKHRRLIDVTGQPNFMSVSASQVGVYDIIVMPRLKDDTVVATFSADAADCDFQMSLTIAFGEGLPAAGQPVLRTLRHFCRLAEAIIQAGQVNRP